MWYFTHLSTEQHKVWNYTSGVKTLLCLQSRAFHSSQTVPLKKLSGDWQSRNKLWVCTAVQLSSYCGGKFSPVISWGCQHVSQRNPGDEVDLANKDLPVRQRSRALTWNDFLIVSGKERTAIPRGGLIPTTIFNVGGAEGLKSVTTSHPSETQSPREDSLFWLDSMWNNASKLPDTVSCRACRDVTLLLHWQTVTCTGFFCVCVCVCVRRGFQNNEKSLPGWFLNTNKQLISTIPWLNFKFLFLSNWKLTFSM